MQAAVSQRGAANAQAPATQPRRRTVLVKPWRATASLCTCRSRSHRSRAYGSEGKDAAATVITASLDAYSRAPAKPMREQYGDAVRGMPIHRHRRRWPCFGQHARRRAEHCSSVPRCGASNTGFQAQQHHVRERVSARIRRHLRRSALRLEDRRAAAARWRPVQHQAVALMLDGADQGAQFENVRPLGLQDTLYMKTQGRLAAPRAASSTRHTSKAMLTSSSVTPRPFSSSRKSSRWAAVPTPMSARRTPTCAHATAWSSTTADFTNDVLAARPWPVGTT